MHSMICVLFSGGVESCVLVGLLAEEHVVFPLRVHYGLRWENDEQAACERFLSALSQQSHLRVRPLAVVSHIKVPEFSRPAWSLRGPVPDVVSPASAVELPNRNRILLEEAARFCAPRYVHQVAIGTLAENPFADAAPQFFTEQEDILTQRYGYPLQIVAPFHSLTKAEVLRRGTAMGLPLEHSLSCLNPLNGGIHCGACNKCTERQQAFSEAGIVDPTPYAVSSSQRASGRTGCDEGQTTLQSFLPWQ